MPVTRSTTTRRLSPGRTRVRRSHVRVNRPAERPQTGAPAASAAADTVSARRAGGPQDFAFYACSCGSEFRAGVGISVGCPGCGAAQDW
jgi:hypothetical protein